MSNILRLAIDLILFIYEAMKHVIFLTLMLVLSSCGFQPMYGSYDALAKQEHRGVQGKLAQIEIANIPNREGQFLRNALIDRFYSDGRPINPRYLLSVSKIEESTYDLDVTITSDTTRAQLTLTTSMQLVDNESKQKALGRKLKASASYNVMESEFATRVSEQSTRENALNDLARQIELQIALYLDRVDRGQE